MLSGIEGAKVFLTSGGGSDAIDTEAKLARAYWTATGKPEKRGLRTASTAPQSGSSGWPACASPPSPPCSKAS